MAITQSGALNTTAIIVPDLYIQIVPPQNLVLNGVPSNTIGVVGSAQWGATQNASIVGSMQQYAQQFGALQNRKYDMGTAVAAAVQQGAAFFRCVRVTDGTDTAATGQGPASSNITFTSLYTGSLGNSITASVGPGARAGTNALTVGLPGVAPERYDNQSSGVYSNTVSPGTGITVVPSLTFAAPSNPLGTTATGTVNLATVGTPTVGAGGTGYAIGDTISLANGVVVKVLTLSTTAVATFSAQGTSGTALGSVSGQGTAVPTNPMAQISTSGTGTGATVTVAWGLGSVTMTNPGSLYTASPTATVGSGTGTPGTVTPIASIWGAFANAVNKGSSVSRGPSQIITAAAGTGTTAPANATYTLSGGTDGAAGVTAATLVGADSAIGGSRTGMYVLRGTGCSIGMLADADDSTQWTTIDALGSSEGIYMIQVLPPGTSITAAITAKQNAGLDDYPTKLMHGDWIWWNDQVNGITRLISPQGFVAGRLGNLSPQNSSLNKQLYSVVGSQKSGLPGLGTAQQYSGADLQALFVAGIDVIANPQPGGFYWGVRCGHNSSSNAAINGDNYTRMTNYIAATLNAGMGKFVGEVINNDLMRRVRSTLLSFLGNLLQQGLLGILDGTGGGSTGVAVGALPYSVICDASNNPISRTSIGYLQADVQVRYQAINEKFLVNLEGGTTVQVSRQLLPPAAA